MWVWRIRDRHSKPPAKCRPCRGSKFGTLTRHGMPGSHHIVPRDAARTTGPHDRVGGRLPSPFSVFGLELQEAGHPAREGGILERDQPCCSFLLSILRFAYSVSGI